MPSSTGNILREIWSWAEKAPDRPACIFRRADGREEGLGFGKLRRMATERSLVLADLPVGARVGLIAPHGPEFLVQALAIMEAGHCLVPINGSLPPGEITDLIQRAALHGLWRAGKLEILAPPPPLDGGDDSACHAVEPAYLRFTSGSTGRRKGVLLGQKTILERTAVANVRLGISPADRVLCLLPMVDHFVVSILLYLRFGATVLLVEDEKDALALAAEHRATMLYGSPVQYRVMVASPGDFSLESVRLAISTTQGLSATLAADFLQRFQLPLIQALGIIEAGLLTLNDDRAEAEPLLAGRPMPDYRITIQPGDGIGEIHVAGPGLLDAYVSPWVPRAELVGRHGFPTGDHGWLDERGSLHLAGRGRNLVELHGRPIYCEEIEARLNEHPGVRESLVFVENGRLCAQVVPSNGTVNHAALAELGPEKIVIVQSLPRTATGKLRRI